MRCSRSEAEAEVHTAYLTTENKYVLNVRCAVPAPEVSVAPNLGIRSNGEDEGGRCGALRDRQK